MRGNERVWVGHSLRFRSGQALSDAFDFDSIWNLDSKQFKTFDQINYPKTGTTAKAEATAKASDRSVRPTRSEGR